METIFEIGKVILICLEVLLLFNLLIVVHEVGHFVAARWRGLQVDKFALWFGPALWKKTIRGIEYRIGCIPAGGFVSIPQMAPMEVIEGKASDVKNLPSASPWDKIIVAFAGPLFSFLLAVTFAIVVWGVGRPVSEAETSAIVGYVEPHGPAADAGIRMGDKILSVDGNPVGRFVGMEEVSDSVIWNVIRSVNPTIPVVVERENKRLSFEVTPVIPENKGMGRQHLRQIGILPAQLPIIAKIFDHSPAAEAGLRRGDAIVAVNGQPVYSVRAFADNLQKDSSEPLQLTVQRGSRSFQVIATPRPPQGDRRPRLGILWDDRGVIGITHPSPMNQIVASATTIWKTLSAITSPHSEIKVQHLSGFVGIMRLYYMSFVAPEGWRMALWFSVVLNVNLAILNLLPIPPLDGGHILVSLIEAVRRRPIHQRILERIQTAFALVVIGLMLYLAFYDIQDIPWKGQKMAVPEMKFPK
ncbi:MAG: RIP metalloprotease RseP [Verrucomicrobia bacterium]|nr:MAG: RIP metalloprotease RseP [Verrucomicrobiota bacterium]